jgi:hypothetical protein
LCAHPFGGACARSWSRSALCAATPIAAAFAAIERKPRCSQYQVSRQAHTDGRELQIEKLSEAIERSRRLRLAGRALVVIGPMLLAGFALGLVSDSPTRVIVALALAIGGVVLMGSSRSSTEELERSLKQAEAERIAAIDALNLIPVGDRD